MMQALAVQKQQNTHADALVWLRVCPVLRFLLLELLVPLLLLLGVGCFGFHDADPSRTVTKAF
jgi:hypothetical protein